MREELHKAKRELVMMKPSSNDLPRDKERNVMLVEIIEPDRDLNSMILSISLRNQIENLIIENKKADLLHSYGLQPARKILFCGPPGCGKTVAASVIAKELHLPLILVRFDAIVSSYLGETASNLRKVFDYARTRPFVLFFDEFDAVGKSRTNFDEHGELKRVVNSFLQIMDSFKGHGITIAATNHQGLIDHALWRRFDEILFFDKPDANQINDLLVNLFRQRGISKTINLSALAKTLVGMTHAEIERLALDALKGSILNGQDNIEKITLLNAVERHRKRTQITSALDTNQSSTQKSLKSEKKKKQ